MLWACDRLWLVTMLWSTIDLYALSGSKHKVENDLWPSEDQSHKPIKADDRGSLLGRYIRGITFM